MEQYRCSLYLLQEQYWCLSFERNDEYFKAICDTVYKSCQKIIFKGFEVEIFSLQRKKMGKNNLYFG